MRTLTWLVFFLLTASVGEAQSIAHLKQRIQQLEQQSVSRHRDTTLACLLDSCARYWILGGQPIRATPFIERFEHISARYHWPYGQALLLYRKAHQQGILGNNTLARHYFLQALERLKKLPQRHVLLATYAQMASSQIMNDLTDTASLHTALRILDEGRNESLKTPERLFYSALCYHTGRTYLYLKDYQRALHFLTESRLESQRQGVKKLMFYHSLLFSVCYTHLGDEKNRRKYWSYCQSFLPRLDPEEHYFYYEASADMHLFYRQYRGMIADGKKMSAYASQIKAPTKALIAHQILYTAYRHLAQPALALNELEQIKRLEDSTQQQRSKVQLAELQLKYNLKQQQEAVDQLIIANQRTRSWFLAGAIFILLLFLIVILYNNRQLRQKNRAITEALLRGQILERQRVAADLHDNLGTTLSALRWNLDAMDKSKLSTAEQSVYATISQQVGQAYDDVRLLSHNLLPNELAKQGLAVALQTLVDKLDRNTSVRFTLEGADTLPRLDAQTEFELYSICLELLNNILRHARATECLIAIQPMDTTLQLIVLDNGAGFNGEQQVGRGLQNVAARVDALSGTWAVSTAAGVQHQIVVPLRQDVRTV